MIPYKWEQLWGDRCQRETSYSRRTSNNRQMEHRRRFKSPKQQDQIYAYPHTCFLKHWRVRFKNRITVILSGTDLNQLHRAIIVLRDTWSPRNYNDKKHLTFFMFSLLQIKVKNNNTEIGFLFYLYRLKKILWQKEVEK